MSYPNDLEEREKMLSGSLYWAFGPLLTHERNVAAKATHTFNNASPDLSRREVTELIAKMIPTLKALPPKLDDLEADSAQFDAGGYPYICPPFRVDYGKYITLGDNVFINFGCTILDPCRVTIGSRVLFGPNVSLYTASHPLDPEVRNGTAGPELGKEIHIADDVWISGGVIVLGGVTIGKAAVVGAGSVVTKNVAPFTVVAGNPAKWIKDIECPAADAYHKTLAEEKGSV